MKASNELPSYLEAALERYRELIIERRDDMSMIWSRMVDAVHCTTCNEVHGENEVVECNHCEKFCCPSCGDVSEDEDGMYFGYHKPCAAYVDGESDIDPVTQGQTK